MEEEAGTDGRESCVPVKLSAFCSCIAMVCTAIASIRMLRDRTSVIVWSGQHPKGRKAHHRPMMTGTFSRSAIFLTNAIKPNMLPHCCALHILLAASSHQNEKT